MSVLLSQSIFYNVTRILNKNRSKVSYYQFRALSSLIEAIILHNEAYLFVGEEKDKSFIDEYDWLIKEIQRESDFKINTISNESINSFITKEEKRKFIEICNEVYKYTLGITVDDIFVKQKKDRTEEDMSERIENAFIKKFPNFIPEEVSDEIYYLWQSNSNSSELMYFFRTHLIQAISETRFFTPIFENQKLLSSLLQKSLRQENRIGTLPYTIYNLINSLFISECKKLSYNSNYPSTSILLNAVFGNIESRADILKKVFELREDFFSFREHYKSIEEVLINQNLTIIQKSVKMSELHDSLQQVWLPILSSFTNNYSSNPVWQATKSFFTKYGIGELKASVNGKSESTETSLQYSTPSAFGATINIIQTISETNKKNGLYKPSRPLLKLVEDVVKQSDMRRRFEYLLPVKHFNYRINRLLEKSLSEFSLEVAK